MPEVLAIPEIPVLGIVRRLGAFVIAGLTMFGAYVLVALAAIMITGCFLGCTDPNPWGWLVAAAAVVVLVAGVFGAARLVDARLWGLRGIATPVALVGAGVLAHSLVVGGIVATVVLWAPGPRRRPADRA